MDRMPPPLLRLREVSKSFGAVQALRQVSFSLQPGEVHALMGENGSGKSTLIRIITGAHQPDSGSIELQGRVIPRLNPATARALGVAAIYQQPALLPDLSAAENIALGLESPSVLGRVRWSDRRRRASALLGQIGAEIDADAEIRTLSMPEQQLVEIARALGAGARVLIMDEPTASLTDKEVTLLLALIKNLRSRGTGVIYVSHRLGEIFQIADRVTVLRDGECVGTDPIDQINQEKLIKLMVGREVSTIFPPPEGAPGGPVLSLRGLGCRAAGIRGVSFDVRAGEIFGLSGLVGAGRTELARVLFGLTPADTGEIHLAGRPVTIRSPREAIRLGLAYVPEDRRRHGVILEMPVAANMTMGIHPRLFPRGWLRLGAEEALARDYIRDLGIKTPSAATRAGHLSGGNQQKVALARWLASNPKVLVLDEPTQGVDIGAKAELHKLIRRLAARGLAVLMISSDLPEILGMSDRIGVMRGGALAGILEGPGLNAHQVMAAALGHTLAGPRSEQRAPGGAAG